MKPPPFQYERADSVADAIALLEQHGERAKVLAGGQTLIAQLSRRDLAPTHLIDITRASDLPGIVSTDLHVEIGAHVRQAEAEDSALIRRAVPLLAEGLAKVAYREVRNAGTICGSLAYGDPRGEIPTVVLTLDGEMVVIGPRGQRLIKADQFFVDCFRTALEPDEILTSVRIPVRGPSSGSCFRELAPSKGGYAIAGVAATLRTEHGTITSAAIGLLGVARTPVRSPRAEELLVGNVASAALFAEAAAVASTEIDPPDDVHAPSSYRRHLAGALTREALAGALTTIQEIP